MNWILLLSLVGYCLCKEYKAVDQIDLEKYTGKWVQVYGDKFNNIFQSNGRCSTAIYHLEKDGKISVHNQQLDESGKINAIDGYAYYKEGDCCGYLTVQLNDLKSAPYWVLELGPIKNNQYQYSIISDNNALTLFVITRNEKDFNDMYKSQVLTSLENFGFTKIWNKPVAMNQTDC